jgi:hypothetical protein
MISARIRAAGCMVTASKKRVDRVGYGSYGTDRSVGETM